MKLNEHLSDLELADFMLGKLPDSANSAAESHLATCSECQQRAAVVPSDDTLVKLLASAVTCGTEIRGGDATPQPKVSSDSAATRVWSGAAPGSVPVVVGLSNHPRYKLVRQLGVGGMGAVWLAEHSVMGRPVALKVIRPDMLSRPGAVERFRREVRAVAALHHPNIVTAFDADEADGSHFLVMEYIRGESLADAVRRGPLPPAEACRTVRDAARGLAHAHAAGLIHRDVKPANLIRATDSTTKVLDFGLVAASAGDSADLTGENMVMGTPDYIAPEQAGDARAADARSDVYALGCTLYHLLAGQVPFPAGTTIEKLDAHRDLSRMPEPVPGIPGELARVLAKMMAKSPAARYQTAAAVADALDRVCVTVDEDAPTVTMAMPTGQLAPRRPRRRVIVAVGLVFLCAAVAAGGVVYKVQRDNEIVTITTDDPDIEVTMRRNGELVRITDTKTKQTWEVDTKKMWLRADGSELSIDVPGKEPLVIRRNGAVAVTVQRAPATPTQPEQPVVPVTPGGSVVLNLEQNSPALKLVRSHKWLDRHAFITAFSPGGNYYAASGEIGTTPEGQGVRVWDATGGEQVLTAAGAGFFAFDPTDRQLYTYTANDHVIRGWNLKTKKVESEFKGHTAGVASIIASADGQYLVSTGGDQTVRIWSVAKRAELHKIVLDGARALFVAHANDGKSVVVYDYWMQDKTFRLIDMKTGTVTRRWAAPDEQFTYLVQASADGKTIATVHPKAVRIWLAGADSPARTIVVREGINAHALSPDLNWFLFIGSDFDARLIDLRTGKVHGTYRLPHGAIGQHGFSPDGRSAIICTIRPSTVYILDVSSDIQQSKEP